MPAPTRAHVGLAAVLLLIAPVVGACGAGRDSVTQRERSAVDGAQADAGDLQLRNIHLAAPTGGEWAAGSDVPVVMYIVNRGAADELTSVSAPGFAAAGAMAPPTIAIGQGGLVTTSAELAGSPGQSQVVLTKLTKRLLPGQTVSIVFSFKRAGEVTLAVPVATS